MIFFRYDKEGLGAIFTHRFLRRIGVDTSRPKSLTARDLPMRHQKLKDEIKSRPRSEAMALGTVTGHNSLTDALPHKPATAGGKPNNVDVFIATELKEQSSVLKSDVNPTTQEENKLGNATTDNTTTEVKPAENGTVAPQPKVKIPKRNKSLKLDNVVDCLHYRVGNSL